MNDEELTGRSRHGGEVVYIYHSVWKTLLLVMGAGFLAFGSYASLGKGLFLTVIGIVGLIFFGYGGLYILWLLASEMLFNKPYIQIFHDGVVVRGRKPMRFMFSDVKKFRLIGYNGTKKWSNNAEMIGVVYKDKIEERKTENSSMLGKKLRRFNVVVGGAPESFATSELSMSSKAIFDLLQQRLEEYNSNNTVQTE